MTSQLFSGNVAHERLVPVGHRFVYRVSLFFLDLNKLNGSKLLKHNKFGVFSIYDTDYLAPGSKSLILKVRELLGELSTSVSSVRLLTSARVFGWVFNPASFFFCYDSSGDVIAIILEVHNTFSERHLYVLNRLSGSVKDGATSKHQKEFYVSPFNSIDGEYEYFIRLKDDVLDLRLNIRKNGEIVFKSSITGSLRPFTDRTLLYRIGEIAILPWLNLPRILWQAANLYYHKKLPFMQKPTPTFPLTYVDVKPTLLEQFALRTIFAFLRRLKVGKLEVILPTGERVYFGDIALQQSCVIEVLSYKFFTKCLFEGDIGFGEAYTSELWRSSNLTDVLTLFINNEYALSEQPSIVSKIGQFANIIRHLTNKNSLSGSKRNIKAHYDLSNDLFQLFLDGNLMYSAGVYRSDEDSLEQAQQNKIDLIIRKLKLTSSDHLLEIGSGWGGFAIQAVKQTGCRVTTITLSEEQKKLAEERIRRDGLQSSIEVKLIDYRNVQGRYDKIVSIEMIEAVGREFLTTYFEAISRLLKPSGLALIQAITIPDQRYPLYCRTTDWIQKHIFPGSHIPSLGAMIGALSARTSLLPLDIESIGLDYAKTLREWRIRFNRQSQTLKSRGFGDDFQRAWNYYFSYCEAGFQTRALNDVQLLLTKP